MDVPRAGLEWALWTTRWLARGLSLVSIATIAMFVGADVPMPSRVAPAEWVGLGFFPFGVVIGMVVAWKHEGVGCAIGLASLASFYVVYGRVLSGDFPRGWAFLAFSLPLFMFLGVWIASRLLAGDDNRSRSTPSHPAAG